MSIRKKLIMSNVLLIVVPVLVALITLAIFTEGPGGQAWETMELLFDDYNGTYTAQSQLETLEWRGDFTDAKKALSRAGYHFSITAEGEVIYSNLTKADVAAAKKALGDMYDGTADFTYDRGDVAVVKYTSEKENYQAIGIHTSDNPGADTDLSYMEKYIMLYIGFMIAIIIAVVVVMNIIMSWWIARNILAPLKKLSLGSEMIRKGELDFELAYPKKDEMGQVISDFNDMRRYLKDSVTERVKYEQYRRELINGISHDLRTPLTSIKGYVSGLRDGIASTPEMKVRYYEAIETGVGNLEHLVDDLTNFSRVEMGESHVKLEETDLAAYYRERKENLSLEYSIDGVEIDMEVPDTPVTVRMDKQEMDRINRNIIENSIKYRSGEWTIFKISVGVTKDKMAEIRLCDDGPGVSDKELEKIFTCFYRSDASRKNPAGGSGIGLAVVKQIVELQNGKVHAENDGGLAIVIDLPLSEGERNV